MTNSPNQQPLATLPIRRGTALARYVRARPITSAFILLALCLALRINDIFVLKIDERWGEIILSKGFGFLLILGLLAVVHERPALVGLHSRRLTRCLLIGAALTVVIYLFAYGTEFFLLASAGEGPSFTFAAIDSKQGVNGGAMFAGFLVFGNVVNALMEEGLFRGLFLPALMTRFTFWKANLIQAALFAVWHLVWPVKAFLTGESSLMGAVVQALLLLLGSFINGVFWGYLFYRTDSLWAPISAHLVANSLQNLVHVDSAGGLDAMISMRGTVAGVLGVVAIGAIALIASRMRLARLEPLRLDQTTRATATKATAAAPEHVLAA